MNEAVGFTLQTADRFLGNTWPLVMGEGSSGKHKKYRKDGNANSVVAETPLVTETLSSVGCRSPDKRSVLFCAGVKLAAVCIDQLRRTERFGSTSYSVKYTL